MEKQLTALLLKPEKIVANGSNQNAVFDRKIIEGEDNMKTSSIFKKASVFAIAIVMALLMVVSVLPAVFAAEGAATENFGEKLAASNVSLSGSVKMLYYFTDLDTYDADDYIKIEISRDGDPNNKKPTVITYTKGELEGKKDTQGRYVVEVPVPYAQQTETITMQWFHDGVGGTIRRKSVKEYATKVLEYAKSEDKATSEKYQPSVPTITNMLNAGAMTQLHLDYKTNDLANAGLFVSNPVDNMLAEHFYDVESKNDFTETNKNTGIEFVGTQVFLQSQINLRIYLTCPGDVKEAYVYKGEDRQKVKIKDDGEGRKYIGINNIVSTDFGTRFKIEVANGNATAEYEYSVLDWALDAVNSPFATPAQKDLAKSLYLFYTYTRDYVDNTDGDDVDSYVPGPKEKDENGKLVIENNVPVAKECTHTRKHTDGASVICSDCGVTIEGVSSQIFVTAKVISPVKVGKPGEISFTFAIAGNIELSSLLFTPKFPEGVTATVKSTETEWHDGFEGEFALNGLVEDANVGKNGTFTSGKMVTVVYTIEANEATTYTVGIAVRGATDATGTNLEADTLATIVTGTASFEVGPEECADSEHTFKYSNLGAKQHAILCTKCNKAEVVDHAYTAETYTLNGKTCRNTAVCECGSLGADNAFYSYETGFALDADDNKTEKAPLFLLTPSEIATKAANGTRLGAIEMAEDGSYVTIHNKTDTTAEGYFSIISSNQNETGRYLAIKYRTKSTSNMEFFAGANNGKTAAAGGENFYLTNGAILVKDGEWHVAILDLGMLRTSQFKPDDDGKYRADYIRWDIFNDPKTTDQTVDIAYVAMSNDIMSVASFDGNDYYRVGTSLNKESVVVPSYMGSTVTLNPVADAAWINGATHSGGQTHVVESDSANGGLKYSHITRKGTTGDNYVTLVSIPSAATYSHWAHTTDNAHVLAIIYRTNTSATHHEGWVNSTASGGQGSQDKFLGHSVISAAGADYKWRVAIVNLDSAFQNGDGSKTNYYDPAIGMSTLRFDYWNINGETDIAEGELIGDFAFFGVFESTDDAYAYCGDYLEKYNVDCAHDATTGWQFIDNAGTEYEGTRYAVEAKKCALCGEVMETRMAVVSLNFDNVHAEKADGTDDSSFRWGTGSSEKAGDVSKRTFSLLENNLFLKDATSIQLAGWSGINGLFAGTGYYRVLDANGNVLLDWTASSTHRNGSNAGTNVQNAVNAQLKPLGVTNSDARRWNTDIIKLDAYASYYQAENSRHENAPITFEYAFQAEDAPTGSDLITVVKITNIYKTCTSHKIHNATVEENGKLTVYTECANCGHFESSYTMDIGNKAPNYFIGAADLADRVAADSQTMSKTYTLSDDGSYVTLSNTAGKGDGYVNIFSGNKTVTGRYMVIKYRTTAGGGWQFYTSSNSATPQAGKGGDTFYLTGTTHDNTDQNRVKGGMISDGNWHYTIVDLAMLSAFKPYDDGSYMAQYFRWDIFDTKHADTKTTDVAYIAFADDIETLKAMDDMVTFQYAFTQYSGKSEAAVLPMSTTVGANNPFFDANHLAAKGIGLNSSTVLKKDEANKNMPYAQFTSTKTTEQYFEVWNNMNYKIAGSGKYIGVLYRAPSNSATNFEFFVSSNRSSAVGGCNKSVSITRDNQWRFVYVDISTLKTSDGAYWYKDSDGLGQLRFDVLNSGMTATATIDIGFLGFFDSHEDMAATLTAYNELYGLSIPTTPLLIDSDDTTANLGGTFDVTISGVKGAFTSGTFSVADLPAGATIANATFGAGVTATVSGNNIVVTNIDHTVFDGTIATITYKVPVTAEVNKNHNLYVTASDMKNGDKTVSRMGENVNVHTVKVINPMFGDLFHVAGTSNLKGSSKVTEANGLTYNKYIVTASGTEVTINLYNNATTAKNVSDYLVIIYRAPSTVMYKGQRMTNKPGYYEAYIHSTATSAQGGSSKTGVNYTTDGMWHVGLLDLTSIGATYDPATGMASLRYDYLNGDANQLVEGSELQIAYIGFVASKDAANECFNTFLSMYYPEGQTAYVTPDVCSTEHHTHLGGWVSAGVAEDGNLLENKLCASCNAVMETRNVYFRGWMNGYYINDTKIDSGNLYQNSSAIDLAGKGVATTFQIQGWFATESGVHTYYYRVNGGEWIAFTNTELYSKENTGIRDDVNGQNKGISNYWTNSQFNGHLTTGDLTVDYAGKVVTLDFGFAPNNNPTAIQLVKTFTNLQVAGEETIPTYVYLNNIGGTIKGVTYRDAFEDNTALTTSASAGYEGKIYISGRVAIEGSAQKLVYRLLDANGNQIQEWKELDFYSTNDFTMKDVTGTSHLSTAKKEVPEVTNAYEYVGLANITAFPGQTVTVECALVLDGVEGEDAYYTFMTFKNVTNTESAS